MSKPSIAVVSLAPASGPMYWAIVDLKVVDDSVGKRGGEVRMFARDADPHRQCPPWVEFKIVLGCFETFEQAYEARRAAQAIWDSESVKVDAADTTCADAYKAWNQAKAGVDTAMADRRHAIRAPFIGTPTEYR